MPQKNLVKTAQLSRQPFCQCTFLSTYKSQLPIFLTIKVALGVRLLTEGLTLPRVKRTLFPTALRHPAIYSINGISGN